MYFPADLWLRAFALTVLVELPIVAYLLRRLEPDRVRLVVLILFANLATHPAVWFIFTQPFLVGTPAYYLAAESWAVVAETVFYWAAFRGLAVRRAFLVALGANAASFLVGEVLAAAWPGLFS